MVTVVALELKCPLMNYNFWYLPCFVVSCNSESDLALRFTLTMESAGVT